MTAAEQPVDPLPAMRTRFVYDNLTNETYAIMEPDPLGTQLSQDDKVDVAVSKVHYDADHIDKLVEITKVKPS